LSLLTIIRSGVKVIDKVTRSLQANVTHQAWLGADEYGAPTYGSAVVRRALVDQQQHEHRTKSGELVATQAAVTFLDPIMPNGAPGRTEPIDANDLITLPDGTTGPIVDIAGFVDAGTNMPILSEVWIGKGERGQ
jgi:hypothetical protein